MKMITKPIRLLTYSYILGEEYPPTRIATTSIANKKKKKKKLSYMLLKKHTKENKKNKQKNVFTILYF